MDKPRFMNMGSVWVLRQSTPGYVVCNTFSCSVAAFLPDPDTEICYDRVKMRSTSSIII